MSFSRISNSMNNLNFNELKVSISLTNLLCLCQKSFECRVKTILLKTRAARLLNQLDSVHFWAIKYHFCFKSNKVHSTMFVILSGRYNFIEKAFTCSIWFACVSKIMLLCLNELYLLVFIAQKDPKRIHVSVMKVNKIQLHLSVFLLRS